MRYLIQNIIFNHCQELLWSKLQQAGELRGRQCRWRRPGDRVGSQGAHPGTLRGRQPGLVQVRGGRHDRRRHRGDALRLHPQRPRVRDLDQPILGRGLQEGLLPLDHSVPQTVRVVHWRPQRGGEKGRYKCSRNSHIYNPILSQVRFENNDVGMYSR